MIQHINQFDTKIHYDNIPPENMKNIPSISKNVVPQQTARFEFSSLTPFVFLSLKKKQKRAFITEFISFTETIINISTNSLPFEKHCYDVFSIPLIREHHDSYLYSL